MELRLVDCKSGKPHIFLEESANGVAKSYSTLIQVLGTLDEGLRDYWILIIYNLETYRS